MHQNDFLLENQAEVKHNRWEYSILSDPDPVQNGPESTNTGEHPVVTEIQSFTCSNVKKKISKIQNKKIALLHLEIEGENLHILSVNMLTMTVRFRGQIQYERAYKNLFRCIFFSLRIKTYGTCALCPNGVDAVLCKDTSQPRREQGQAESGRVHQQQAAPRHHVLELVVLLPINTDGWYRLRGDSCPPIYDSTEVMYITPSIPP